MANQPKPKLEELTSVLAECKDKDVDALITSTETRLKLLREVKRMLGIGNTPKPRTKATEPAAGTVGAKAAS